MVGFTEVLMEEKPTIIRLKKGKFAIKCVKNITMVSLQILNAIREERMLECIA